MKKMFATIAATVVMGSTISMAATPVAPTFSVTTKASKIGEGGMFSPDGRTLAIDGTTLYASFTGPNNSARVVRSIDGGLTWGLSADLAINSYGDSLRLALAKDPLNSTKKILCAVWTDTANMSLQYAYFRPSGNGWSTPVTIAPAVDYTGITMAAAPNGSIHVIFNDLFGVAQYATASSATDLFSQPVSLGWEGSGNLAITADSSNNLYAAETGNNVLRFHKKTVGSSSWSTVTIDTNTGDNVSIALYDSNNIYIAYLGIDYDVAIAVSTNGGTLWTKRAVNAAIAATTTTTHPSIAVSAGKVLALASYSRNPSITYVNKSSDNGVTWSTATQIAGNRHPSIAFDSAGKINMVSYIQLEDTPTTDSFLVGTATDPYSNPVYYTKEK